MSEGRAAQPKKEAVEKQCKMKGGREERSGKQRREGKVMPEGGNGAEQEYLLMKEERPTCSLEQKS